MRILITAGGTREYIDPVRFISNASTGKMGFALARAALKAGHKVTFITTVARRSSLVARDTGHERQVTVVEVETAREMFKAVKKYLPKSDCLIMAAAVADYTPAYPSKTKIKRTTNSLTIKLKPTPDILKWAGQNRRPGHGPRGTGQFIVGFALEDKDLRVNAEKKLEKKNLDMIIANTPAAVGADKSTVHIKTLNSSWLKIENATKATIARKIIILIERVFS